MNSGEDVYVDAIDSGLRKDLRYFERNFRKGKPSNRQVQIYAVWPDAKEMLLSFKIDDSVGMYLMPRDSSFDKESYIRIREGSWIRAWWDFTSQQQLDTSYKDVRELASTLVWSSVDLTGSIRKANARDIMFDGGYVVISSSRCGKMNVSKF